ncbi:IMP cyclohydrolase [candidate division KSB3 bacterium]|uniref:IMP cyclohydrolase n=1 Tax=candidate division KSB3 bacterium TaxID=2044937 RepID=A0A2G6EE88_9BACT|nr:MAG: IMP cyclohydrolase [candidate division KSB3 bacterium]PIE28383.1 MAG: IMP cyclohydrolase [candidate division KSB3 bacterium]
MSSKDFRSDYNVMMDDRFPEKMEVSFIEGEKRQTLVYEKVVWSIDGIEKGLRYGENPGQEAALYKLLNGNLTLGDVSCIQPGQYLASAVELLQSGKHPGKINISDADSAMNILRYFIDTPCAVIVKHNNPCAVAKGATLAEAYNRAEMADRVAAFGGVVALNREVDISTAELIAGNYVEVVVAPGYADGVLDIFAGKKNMRVMQIDNMKKLQTFVGQRVLDFRSLMDGGIIVQWSFVPRSMTENDLLPAQTTYKGREYTIDRMPTEKEYEDLLFGWLVETGVTSNSIIYVKDGVTVGIGTGEQDRVGVAEIARDKAYRKLADRICWEKYRTPYNLFDNEKARAEIDEEVQEKKGGLPGSSMVSDAFFPFRDAVDVGIREGIRAIIQPGGSLRDFESIEACNEAAVTMVYTGQRSFRH